MHNIILPYLNTNDEYAVLLKWHFDNGQLVKAGQTLAMVETSKATVDLTCEQEGLFYQCVTAGAECAFGKVLGYIFQDEEEMRQFFEGGQPADATAPFTSTHAAQALIDQHALTPSQLRALKKKVITKADIESLLARQTNGTSSATPVTLSRHQLAVARTVTVSHETIPASFLLLKIDATHALALRSFLQKRLSAIVSFPELLIKIVAFLFASFPLCFARLQEDFSVLSAQDAHIGITIDMGKGLFIPVIKQATQKSIQEIAETMMEFRIKGLSNAFQEEEISGGNISLSLHTEADVILALPIIPPTQVCMLSLCSLQEECFLDGNENVQRRSYFHLGLTYDHRLINGREAGLFLRAIKVIFESATKLQEVILPPE